MSRHLERPRSWLPVSKAMQRARPGAAPCHHRTKITRKSRGVVWKSYDLRPRGRPREDRRKVARKSYDVVSRAYDMAAAEHGRCRAQAGPKGFWASWPACQAGLLFSYGNCRKRPFSGPSRPMGASGPQGQPAKPACFFMWRLSKRPFSGPSRPRGLLGFVATLLSPAEIVR